MSAYASFGTIVYNVSVVHNNYMCNCPAAKVIDEHFNYYVYVNVYVRCG